MPHHPTVHLGQPPPQIDGLQRLFFNVSATPTLAVYICTVQYGESHRHAERTYMRIRIFEGDVRVGTNVSRPTGPAGNRARALLIGSCPLVGNGGGVVTDLFAHLPTLDRCRVRLRPDQKI